MTTRALGELRSIKREDTEAWERVAWSELLIPNEPNVYGDYWTAEAIVRARDLYMQTDYKLDVEHDNVDVRNKGYYVIESFIARPGDPDFIEGAWVIGVKFIDDDLWNQVLSGELNGFSYEANVLAEPVTIEYNDEIEQRIVTGVTEPDPFDGHTHTFTVVVGPLNKVISGSTGETDGHYHSIRTHTLTGKASGHTHRYQVLGD